MASEPSAPPIPPAYAVDVHGGLRVKLDGSGKCTWSGEPLYDDPKEVLAAIDTLIWKVEKRATLLRHWRKTYLQQNSKEVSHG
jgi:hypothetical protein